MNLQKVSQNQSGSDTLMSSEYFKNSSKETFGIALDDDLAKAKELRDSVNGKIDRDPVRVTKLSQTHKKATRTILFESDWDYYPNAIIDTKTKNKSFLRQAGLYKSMGVKNHAFLLALLNPDLQGIDPFGPEVMNNQELQTLIYQEARANPWYAFRECFRAPGRGATTGNWIEARRHFISFAWCYYNHMSIDTVAPRQTGKSFGCYVVYAYGLGIRGRHARYVMLVHTDLLRQSTVQNIKLLIDTLPRYLNGRDYKSDNDNMKGISIGVYDNELNVLVGQKSAAGAEAIGRGGTAGNIELDETAYTDNIGLSAAAIGGTAGAYVEECKRNGVDYCTSTSTTAGDLTTDSGRWAFNLLESDYPWSDFLFDCKNREEFQQIVANGCRRGRIGVNATFNHRELGFSDKDIAERIKQISGISKEAINKDFFNVWLIGFSGSPFTEKQLAILKANVKQPLYLEINHSAQLSTRWYIEKENLDDYINSHDVLMTVDTSNAFGADDVAITFQEASTAGVIGAATFNENLLGVFFNWVYEKMMKYPKLVLLPENRSTGSSLIDYLIQRFMAIGEDPFKRIFNTIVDGNIGIKPTKEYMDIAVPIGRRDPDVAIGYRSSFGYATSAFGEYSRNALYGDTLSDASKSTFVTVSDQAIAEQISKLIRKNGRIDHPVNGHDDLVVSWLLGQWFWRNAKNLTHYGITSANVMKDVRVIANDRGSQISQDEMAYQKELRNTLRSLAQKMVECDNPLQSIRIESKLNALRRYLKDIGDKTFNMNDIIEKARKDRNERLNKRKDTISKL